MNTIAPHVRGIDQSLVDECRRNRLSPTTALVFHTRSDRLELLTVHEITQDYGNAPCLGPGRPLSPEDECQLITTFHEREAQAAISIFPENLLYSGPDLLIGWLPPAVRPMHLRDSNGKLRTIHTRWPSLVLLVKGRTLYLAASAGEERPTAQSPLYHAPLGNVFGSTLVCTGNATLPLSNNVADLQGWCAVVTDSAFTHANHNRVIQPSRKGARFTDPEDYWRKRDAVVKPFPDQRLNPLGITLGEWPQAVEQ